MSRIAGICYLLETFSLPLSPSPPTEGLNFALWPHPNSLNKWAQRTSEFAILHNKWIKIVQEKQSWSYHCLLYKCWDFSPKIMTKAIRRWNEFNSLKGLVYKLNIFFKFFRRWTEFYTLKSVKASTFCLFKISAKGKNENHKSYLKAYITMRYKNDFKVKLTH